MSNIDPKRYFQPERIPETVVDNEKRQLGAGCVVGGIISVIIGMIVIGVADINAVAVELLLILGGGALFVAGIYNIIMSSHVKYNNRYLSAQFYDNYVKDVIKEIKANPKEALGLDETEVMEIEPIEFEGYKFTGASNFRKGEDGIWRSDFYEKAIIYFTANEVHLFKMTINLFNKYHTESTEVLFYEDVVSVSTQSEIDKHDDFTIDYISFVLSHRGGSEFKVNLFGTDNRQRSINAMRAMIKEKKTKN